jgi:hypothetical protein
MRHLAGTVVPVRIINPDLLPLPLNVRVDPSRLGQIGGGVGMGGMMGGGSMGTMGGTGAGMGTSLEVFARSRGVEPYITARRFDFVIQFAWEETPPSQRVQASEEYEEQEPIELQ